MITFPKVQRTYNEWLVLVLGVAMTYGVRSEQWDALIVAAEKQISFRIWALKYDTESTLGQTVKAVAKC